MDEKIIHILEQVIAKSKDRETVWNKTNRESEYKLKLSAGFITVDNWFVDSSNYYDVNIFNKDGDKIFSIDVGEHHKDANILYEKLKELHTLAVSIFYKADETLNSMFEELKKKGKVGEADDIF